MPSIRVFQHVCLCTIHTHDKHCHQDSNGLQDTSEGRPLRDNQKTSKRLASDPRDTKRPQETKRAPGDHQETTRTPSRDRKETTSRSAGDFPSSTGSASTGTAAIRGFREPTVVHVHVVSFRPGSMDASHESSQEANGKVCSTSAGYGIRASCVDSWSRESDLQHLLSLIGCGEPLWRGLCADSLVSPTPDARTQWCYHTAWGIK